MGLTNTIPPERNSSPEESQEILLQALGFDQHVSLSSIKGPVYLTAQTLVQQAAFTLSDRLYTYSPDTFNLDKDIKQWHSENHSNGFGFTPGLSQMQTRSGAGSIALGYMFSKDFDLEKRHQPQSIVASSGSLRHLRHSLDQLSLLYSLANPVVAHIAAADYIGSSSRLGADYTEAMTLAEDLGLGLVSSTSIFEAQHMSLFATLLAIDSPALHIFDGVHVGRDTTRVIDVLDQVGLFGAYETILKQIGSFEQKRSNRDGKVIRLLQAFNNELGTDYKLFEYYGHAEAESVLVVFGSVEGSLSAQLAYALSNAGSKVGVVNVRVYRPFVEEEFLAAVPKTVHNIAVLGQVDSEAAVSDTSEQSRLFNDVLAAVAFSRRFSEPPIVADLKYTKTEVWTPGKIYAALQNISKESKSGTLDVSSSEPSLDILGPSVRQYSFWNVDDAEAAKSPAAIAHMLSRESTENVAVRSSFDNLTRGGAVRSDLRVSPKSIEAPYSITSAAAIFIGEEKLLADFDVLDGLQERGTIVVNLPGSKEADAEKMEKRLPEPFRKYLAEKQAYLFALDTADIEIESQNLLWQLVFLCVTEKNYSATIQQSLSADSSLAGPLSEELERILRPIDVPALWLTLDAKAAMPKCLTPTSFVPFDKEEKEEPTFLKSWVVAAKGLAFKEATGQKASLRPDFVSKTMTVHVKERRRLTPASYDRNIFHIEFDLGNSGLTYAIGEALGIHAENDKVEIEEFIKWYGLNPDDVVEVPSIDNFEVLENRTVYQSLMQNVDIFGRPPKKFYESLAEFADDEAEQKSLMALAGPEGAVEFKRRAEVDTITYADVLLQFPSAHPSFHDIVRIVNPMKRREYSIASSQKVTPNSVSLLIVMVNWVDPQGRDRFGQATRFMNSLTVGSPVTVSVKPSVMKLPTKSTAPLIMAGLGTGLAPFRAFVQERAWQKQQGMEIGSVLLYMGSRHQREEYLYGEEWEAYQDAGIITLLGRAFSRDQPEKIYIQDRMRQTMDDIRKAYLHEEGAFYLCGPTWPVPDVTEVLQEAITADAKEAGRKVDSRRKIEELKDELRYVLEVY